MVDMKVSTSQDSRFFGQLFTKLEVVLYVVTGILVAAAAAMSLVNAIAGFWGVVTSWGAPREIIVMIDRLLFVLMLLEILHTVRMSIKEGTLNADPFLVVGLIASIRRVLVITLGSSQRSETWTANAQAQFNASLLELAVLALLIAVLVVAIFLLRRCRAKAAVLESHVHET